MQRALVDTQAAATAAGVQPQLVRRWAARYPSELPRHGRDHRGRTLYELDDVLVLAARLRRRRGPARADWPGGKVYHRSNEHPSPAGR